MERIVFYSWQSDSPAKVNRYLIRDCLLSVLKRINKDDAIIDSIRLDHDTANIPGTPDIANTIFEKINESSVFVADLTLLAETKGGKKSPNPNVLIELGYAFSAISGSCVVNVINTAFGEPDDLPFDLVHKRWPIKYSLTEDDLKNKEKVDDVKKSLSDALFNAINLVLDTSSKKNSSVPRLTGTPSFGYIQDCILFADPQEDWERVSDTNSSIMINKHDVNLRLNINYLDEGVQCDDFTEEWANRHPNPSATGYWCDIYYGSTRVFRTILVSVDGGRAMLPIPRQIGVNEKVTEVLPFDYRIA